MLSINNWRIIQVAKIYILIDHLSIKKQQLGGDRGIAHRVRLSGFASN